MSAPHLEPADEDALIDALAHALQDMIDRSCIDMAPLWFEATRAARELLPSMRPAAEMPLSPRLLAACKGSRSKYRVLAAWRHAVIWRRSRDRLDALDREVIDAIYFTPCPNEPPYAWSQATSRSPALPKGAQASWVKEAGRRVAGDLLEDLVREKTRCDHSFRGEIEERLLAVATRDTIYDVLKIEEGR